MKFLLIMWYLPKMYFTDRRWRVRPHKVQVFLISIKSQDNIVR